MTSKSILQRRCGLCTQTILCGLFPSEEEAARQHDRVAQHLAATKPSVGQACSLRIPFATSHPLTTSLGRPNGVMHPWPTLL